MTIDVDMTPIKPEPVIDFRPSEMTRICESVQNVRGVKKCQAIGNNEGRVRFCISFEPTFEIDTSHFEVIVRPDEGDLMYEIWSKDLTGVNALILMTAIAELRRALARLLDLEAPHAV